MELDSGFTLTANDSSAGSSRVPGVARFSGCSSLTSLTESGLLCSEVLWLLQRRSLGRFRRSDPSKLEAYVSLGHRLRMGTRQGPDRREEARTAVFREAEEERRLGLLLRRDRIPGLLHWNRPERRLHPSSSTRLGRTAASAALQPEELLRPLVAGYL